MLTVQKTQTHRAFGVEQEHFVFHADGKPPTHSEIDELWGNMQKRGFRSYGISSQGHVLSIIRETTWGPLIVSTDSCTHIIEVAFPKMCDLTAFINLYTETWNLLVHELGCLGLQLRFGGALPTAPLNVYWRPKESDPKGDRLLSFLTRTPVLSPLFHKAFPACFTATQVSLDITQEDAIEHLSRFYEYEYLIPHYFSNSHEFQKVRAKCIRPLAWVANFHPPYPLLGIPIPIPKTMSQYSELRSLSYLRDYSFIAIRSKNRLEFRSSCSQDSIGDIVKLIRFRMIVDRLVAKSTKPPASDTIIATRFFEACNGRHFGDFKADSNSELILNVLQT